MIKKNSRGMTGSVLKKKKTCSEEWSSLHGLRFGDDSVWIALLKAGHNLRVQEMDPIQLVSKSDPESTQFHGLIRYIF